MVEYVGEVLGLVLVLLVGLGGLVVVVEAVAGVVGWLREVCVALLDCCFGSTARQDTGTGARALPYEGQSPSP